MTTDPVSALTHIEANMTAAPEMSGIERQAPQEQKKGRRFWHGEQVAPGSQDDLNARMETARGSYSAALILTGSIIPLPVVATLITALFYIELPSVPPSFLNGWPTGLPDLAIIGTGVGITFILWLIVSLAFIPFTSFDSANPTSASHFKRHFAALKSAYQALEPYSKAAKAVPDNEQAIECKELQAFSKAYPVDYQMALDSIRECLVDAMNIVRHGKHRWVQGNGYLSVWQFIHRAEEAMFTVAPRASVIREAMHDAASIKGTEITNLDSYLSNLDAAVKVLSPASTIYLKSLPVVPGMPSNGAKPGDGKMPADERVADEFVTQPPGEITSKQISVEDEMAVRSTVRYARNILNGYRSSLWDNLMRIRGQLIGIALGTGVLTFFLLCVAICASVRTPSLLAALVFYLIGAMSGLFSRLILESQSDRAIDDYGLTNARVVVTPVISGLAAIAGILVVSLLSVNIFNTPGQDIGKGVPLPDLSQIYDLVQNRQGLVIAALFGLTPNRFVSILQAKTENTKAQLKSSTAAQGQSTSE